MNEKNTKYLLETYPKLYRQAYLSPQETCMCWLFETSDGWFDIVNDLSSKLEELNNTIYTDNPVEAAQVKEKFGTLRFYYDGGGDAVDVLVSAAEDKSAITCEICGNTGTLRRGGWLVTRCDEHTKT